MGAGGGLTDGSLGYSSGGGGEMGGWAVRPGGGGGRSGGWVDSRLWLLPRASGAVHTRGRPEGHTELLGFAAPPFTEGRNSTTSGQ